MKFKILYLVGIILFIVQCTDFESVINQQLFIRSSQQDFLIFDIDDDGTDDIEIEAFTDDGNLYSYYSVVLRCINEDFQVSHFIHLDTIFRCDGDPGNFSPENFSYNTNCKKQCPVSAEFSVSSTVNHTVPQIHLSIEEFDQNLNFGSGSFTMMKHNQVFNPYALATFCNEYWKDVEPSYMFFKNTEKNKFYWLHLSGAQNADLLFIEKGIF